MSFWLKLGGIAIVLASLFAWHLADKQEAVVAERDKVVLEYTLKMSEARDKRDAADKVLKVLQFEALKKKDDEIKSISDKLNSTLSSLQYYRSCNELTSKPTRIGAPCPSRELSREDAEFLAREAAKAQSVVKERDYYYGRYEDARRSLDSR